MLKKLLIFGDCGLNICFAHTLVHLADSNIFLFCYLRLDTNVSRRVQLIVCGQSLPVGGILYTREV